MGKMYFEDFKEGDLVLATGFSSISQDDIRSFAGLSEDVNSIHLDEEYAKTTSFGGIIAQGMLVLSRATGLSTKTGFFEGAIFLGINDLQFLAPVRPGDEIMLSMKVKEKIGKEKRGIVIFKADVLNQDGKIVIRGEWVMMIDCRQGGQGG